MFEDPFLAVVRARIKAARLARQLRQSDAAELAKMELRNWQRLEGFNPRRKFNPTLETLRVVARVLEVSVGELTATPSLEELEMLKSTERPERVMLPRS